jgi:glyoxylase-like metal-dependent hydrolase (beta-lactamase superfamily II)
MAPGGAKRELGRGERVIRGLWRLRLPLPLTGVPHVNAWALATGSGITLVDCGMHEPGSLAQLEYAMAQVGLALDQVTDLVITHAHVDHWGQALPVVERTGCTVWMHPDHRHGSVVATDPEAAVESSIEIGRQSGASEAAIQQFIERARSRPSGLAGIVEADHHLRDGVVLDSDLGVWQVHETPGHAPSHISLYQPEHRVLLSGDHLLGRVSLYFDYGWTPDPIGEFLRSLDRVEGFGARLCVAGHGRPFNDVQAHIRWTRELVAERLQIVRMGLRGRSLPAFDVAALIHGEQLTPITAGWRLNETLCYLRHLELEGAVERVSDGQVELWSLIL